MTSDSQWALQQAVHQQLSSDAALQALLGNPARVFDHVPQGTAYPYVVIGTTTAAPGELESKTEDAMEQTLTVHTWSRHRGLKETKQIMAAVVDALEQGGLMLANQDLVLLRFQFATTLLEPDGLTRHGVQRFRALTQS